MAVRSKNESEIVDKFLRTYKFMFLLGGIVITIYFLSNSPESLKEFFNLLKDIFSNNKTYWAAIGGLGISNVATYKLYSQKNNATAKLEEALKNYLPQNNKNLLEDIEKLFKKYKNQ